MYFYPNKQKLAFAALVSIVISGLGFLALPVGYATASVSAFSGPAIVATSAAPGQSVLAVTAGSSCSINSVTTQTLVQDQPLINLNQPALCFSISTQPLMTYLKVNLKVQDTLSTPAVAVLPQPGQSMRPVRFDTFPQGAWKFPATITNNELPRLSLIGFLCALYAAAAFALALKHVQRQTAFALLRMRRC